MRELLYRVGPTFASLFATNHDNSYTALFPSHSSESLFPISSSPSSSPSPIRKASSAVFYVSYVEQLPTNRNIVFETLRELTEDDDGDGLSTVEDLDEIDTKGRSTNYCHDFEEEWPRTSSTRPWFNRSASAFDGYDSGKKRLHPIESSKNPTTPSTSVSVMFC